MYVYKEYFKIAVIFPLTGSNIKTQISKCFCNFRINMNRSLIIEASISASSAPGNDGVEIVVRTEDLTGNYVRSNVKVTAAPPVRRRGATDIHIIDLTGEGTRYPVSKILEI